MSYGEFERLEEGADQMELLKGELIRMPPRKRAHMEICERLFEGLKSEVEHLRRARPGLKTREGARRNGLLLLRRAGIVAQTRYQPYAPRLGPATPLIPALR